MGIDVQMVSPISAVIESGWNRWSDAPTVMLCTAAPAALAAPSISNRRSIGSVCVGGGAGRLYYLGKQAKNEGRRKKKRAHTDGKRAFCFYLMGRRAGFCHFFFGLVLLLFYCVDFTCALVHSCATSAYLYLQSVTDRLEGGGREGRGRTKKGNRPHPRGLTHVLIWNSISPSPSL